MTVRVTEAKLTARSVEMRFFLRLTPSDSEEADGELQEDCRVGLGRICSKNYLLCFFNIPINNTYYSC